MILRRCRRLPSGLRVAQRWVGPPPEAILDFLVAARLAVVGDEEGVLAVLLPRELTGVAWCRRLEGMVAVGAVLTGMALRAAPCPALRGVSALGGQFLAAGAAVDPDVIRFLVASHPAEALCDVLAELVALFACGSVR